MVNVYSFSVQKKLIESSVSVLKKAGPKRSLHTETADAEPLPLYTSSKKFWLITCGAGVVIVFAVVFSRRCRRVTRKYT